MDLVSMSFQVSTPTLYNYLVLGTCFCVSSFYIVHCSLFIVNKNALTVAFRSRLLRKNNEEAINSTRNMVINNNEFY